MKKLSAAVSIALLTAAVSVYAQPLAPPPAKTGAPAGAATGQPKPGAPPPGAPTGAPKGPTVIQPGQPGQPIMIQPGQPGQPGQQPGQPPPRRPQRPTPPGVPGRDGPPPGHDFLLKQHPAASAGEGGEHGEHGAHGGGHCPGHGPMDPPGHVNWYQGLLGVNNEKAQSPSFVNKLLWRYENPKDECDPLNQQPPVLAAAINLAVVIFVLFRFGKGPITEALHKRKKTIMQDIDAANEMRVDAEKRLKDYQKRLNKIEDRRKEVKDEAAAQWQLERKRILAEAEEKAMRLRKDAEFRVDQELKQAQSDLLREAVDGAVVAAEKLIKDRIQSADQERLANDYVTGIGAALKSNDAGKARGRVS